MAFNVQCTEKYSVEWSIDVPRVCKSVESPIFKLEGLVWQLKMTTSWNETNKEETWAMSLVKHNKHIIPPTLLLIYYIRGKNGDVLMGHKEITEDVTKLWCYTLTYFFDLYPNDEFGGDKLKFVFTFDYGIGHYKNCRNAEGKVKEHKAVETSTYLDEHYCLKELSLDLHKLMYSNTADLQLKCGENFFLGHKLILRARSEAFSTMLQPDNREGIESCMEIIYMPLGIFQIFVKYLYTGNLPELTEDIALKLYEAGEKYRIKALKNRCGNFLEENLSLARACRIMVEADIHGNSRLKSIVSNIIHKKSPSIFEWRRICEDCPQLVSEVLKLAWTRFIRLPLERL